MKQVITKEEVLTAIEQLTAEGKRPTLVAIHALLNHRGSMSTLVRLKSELQAVTQPAGDSPEGLKTFRQTWAMAVAEGRRELDSVVAELRESLTSLAAENERLEGLLVAAQREGGELERARSLAESEFREYRARVQIEVDQARGTVAQANAKASEALACLAETQAKHAGQMTAMQAERDTAITKAHELELKLVRALALAESNGNTPCGMVWLNHNS
jgi:chromosome segregation ATPase